MTSRETILAAVRANLPSPAPVLPEIPLFERTAGSLLDEFQEALARMGGKFVDERSGKNLNGFVRSLFPQARVICSTTAEVEGNSSPDPQRQSHRFGRCRCRYRSRRLRGRRNGFDLAQRGRAAGQCPRVSCAAPRRFARPFRHRRKPAPRLSRSTVQDGTLCRASYGAFRDRRHRGRVDSWSAGCPQLDSGAASPPDRRRGSNPRMIALMDEWQGAALGHFL